MRSVPPAVNLKSLRVSIEAVPVVSLNSTKQAVSVDSNLATSLAVPELTCKALAGLLVPIPNLSVLASQKNLGVVPVSS